MEINPAALLNVAEVLESVLEEKGPYIMTTTNGLETWDHEINREEMLQHHIEAAIQEINNLLEDE